MPDRSRQHGSTIVATMALSAIVAIFVTISLSLALSTDAGTSNEGRGAVAIQAADAGVNQYVSRLVEDPKYWLHYVDPAEDTRRAEDGTLFAPGSAWTRAADEGWDYVPAAVPAREVQPAAARHGQAVYRLRITPPATGSDIVTIQATGTAGANLSEPLSRTVQSQVNPSSIADFQIVSNASIGYGSTATTTGRLYSRADIDHRGRAQADVFAGRYACSNGGGCSGPSHPSSVYEADVYDSTTDPPFSQTEAANIDFARFANSLTEIRGAAQANGYAFNDPLVSAWLVQFLPNGTFNLHRIIASLNPGTDLGVMGCAQNYAVPPSGAIHFAQSVIVSEGYRDGGGAGRLDLCGNRGPRDSVVDGRVTIATDRNVYVGGNITYETSGDDVLGLIARDNVVMAAYAPDVMSWRAATLAQTGSWYTQLTNGSKTKMTYTGSQTTAGGGYATMFRSREYNYDETLQFLRPPFYPIIEGSWRTRYWREVSSP